MRNETNTPESLNPRLVVTDPDGAAQFYAAAFGASIVRRFTLPNGTVTNIDLAIAGASISLTCEVQEWGLLGPAASGGNPVLFRLTTADARELRDRALDEGAVEVVPVEDRPYGRCEGRVRDPFGHLWILSHITEELDDDEIRRRLEAAYGGS